MFHMRPGNRIPRGQKTFKHRPSIEPPGLLRAVSALSIISIVCLLFYSVIVAVADMSSSEIGIENSIYVAVLHFLLPFGVAYTVTTNNRLSRFMIATYCVVLYVATLSGKGYLGVLPVDFTSKLVVSTASLGLIIAWLFASPKMRYYYACLSDEPVPPDLEARATELAGRNWPGPKARAALEWVTDHMETVVLMGIIIAAVYSCVSL